MAFSQYLLRDDLPKAGVPAIARYPGFESGLLHAAGKHKPSFDGFRLPLAVRRTSSTRVSLWGLVRPAGAATTATIEVRSKGGSFRTLTTVKTDARGYFAKARPTPRTANGAWCGRRPTARRTAARRTRAYAG